MVRHTLEILYHLLQDFKSVFDHFGTLCIKGLKLTTQERFVLVKACWRCLDDVFTVTFFCLPRGLLEDVLQTRFEDAVGR